MLSFPGDKITITPAGNEKKYPAMAAYNTVAKAVGITEGGSANKWGKGSGKYII